MGYAVTQWGMLLMCAYIALGVSSTTRRKAGRLAMVITAIVITAALASYLRSTPAGTGGSVGSTGSSLSQPNTGVSTARAVP
jgi:hypothetical protein